MRLIQRQLETHRGMTLVELMIVVAVVGILAAIGGVAYMNHIKSAKISKLKQYAMEVASGQEQYKAQNSGYLASGENPVEYEEGEDSPKFKQLLGFNREGLDAQDITVRTQSGASGNACSICGPDTPNFDGIWFAVEVSQDLNPEVDDDTTVVYYSGLPEPMIINEGD